MATNSDDWGIQVSIKHGPSDDRGNPLYMTNVRGYTATEVADHLEHLGEHGSRISDGIAAFVAVDTLRRTFPEVTQVSEHTVRKEAESRYGSNDTRGHGSSSGERMCDVHRLPRKRQSGVKNGKPWTGWFCDAPQNKCAPEWSD